MRKSKKQSRTQTGPIVKTTSMKQRERFKRTRQIGDITLTIPCFGKSRSRSR